VAEILTLEVKGDGALLNNLNQLGEAMNLAVERGLFQWGEEVMADSKEHYVPVDTGQLRASGFVLTPSLQDVPVGAVPSAEARQAINPRLPDEIAAVMGFGGPATPYALSVHENPRSGKTGGVSPQGKRYKSWARVGQWKYLHIPVQAHASRLTETVAASVRKMIERVASRGRPR
jgi:hypothetical protein